MLSHHRSLVDGVSIVEFFHGFVCSSFCAFATDIKLYKVLLCSSVSKKYTMVAVWVPFCWSASGFSDRYRASESVDVTHFRADGGPGFFRCFSNGIVVRPVV